MAKRSFNAMEEAYEFVWDELWFRKLEDRGCSQMKRHLARLLRRAYNAGRKDKREGATK